MTKQKRIGRRAATRDVVLMHQDRASGGRTVRTRTVSIPATVDPATKLAAIKAKVAAKQKNNTNMRED